MSLLKALRDLILFGVCPAWFLGEDESRDDDGYRAFRRARGARR